MHQTKKDAPLRSILPVYQIDLRCDGLVRAGKHVNSAAFAVEHHFTVNKREERVVLPLSDTLAGMEFIAKLADEDVARNHLLPAVSFYSPPLAVRVAPVAAGALSLFMCHD